MLINWDYPGNTSLCVHMRCKITTSGCMGLVLFTVYCHHSDQRNDTGLYRLWQVKLERCEAVGSEIWSCDSLLRFIHRGVQCSMTHSGPDLENMSNLSQFISIFRWVWNNCTSTLSMQPPPLYSDGADYYNIMLLFYKGNWCLKSVQSGVCQITYMQLKYRNIILL